MKVSELRAILSDRPEAELHFMLPTGEFVASHFHITEVGRVQKDFIDCGGTLRSIAACVLQVWIADDVSHRLAAGKLADILRLATAVLKSEALPVEVEYEAEFISQFPIAAVEVTPSGLLFHLGTKHTECLAPDRCGVPGSASAGCCDTSGNIDAGASPTELRCLDA